MAAVQSPEATALPTSPLLALPLEVRHMIYREVLLHRSIVLCELPPFHYVSINQVLGLPPFPQRRHRRFRVGTADYVNDSTVSLLQICKQIMVEARPLVHTYTPSQMILKRCTHQGKPWGSEDLERLFCAAQSFEHIVRLTCDVGFFGKNERRSMRCHDPIEKSLGYSEASTENAPNLDKRVTSMLDPPRLPNLCGICRYSTFFTALPALKELHIRGILRHSLKTPPRPCSCPNKCCTCQRDPCACIGHPPLPDVPTKSELHDALLSRLRAALPLKDTYLSRRSDYLTVFNLLVHGVHIFLHEEVAMMWQATYHLSPPTTTILPTEPPVAPGKTLQEARESFQREGRSIRRVDLPWCNLSVRYAPQRFGRRPLVEYETGLQVEIF